MIFTAFFTSDSNPATGLNPAIKFYNVSSGAIIDTGTMTEVGDGFYKYTLTNYTGSVSYIARADGGATLTGRERYYSFANENYVDDIFNANITQYSSNSIGTKISKIYNLVGGRWKIENTQLVIYKDDNITEVMRFNLYDSNGISIHNNTNIFDRRKN